MVRGRQRPVPLDFEYRETPLHETIDELVKSGRAPIYLVNFTQRGAAEQAQNLMSVDIASKEEKEAIRAALDGAAFDTPYGKDFQRFLRHGIGVHHAGLLPKYRLLVERLAQKGLLKVVSGTDTLGVGVNIPIRTVLFTQLCKFDGEKTGILGVRDFQQIAGRAGRKGFDDRGYVVAQAPEHVVENKRLATKQAQGKKVVMHKPPPKGYVHCDRGTFERLVGGTPEPLESRFEVTHGVLLSCLQGGRGAEEDGRGARRRLPAAAGDHRALARRAAPAARAAAPGRGLLSHAAPRGDHQRRPHRGGARAGGRGQRRAAARLLAAPHAVAVPARRAGAPRSRGADVRAGRADAGRIDRREPGRRAAQAAGSLKTEKMAEMKAAGVEYEQRIAELETLEWPKPNRDLIYETFNAFADRHPWVGQENMRPKSVAREMYEGFASFDDYVRSYGLERSEGVLLRYLSQAYKTMAETVPLPARSEEVMDILAHFRTLLRDVDTSLIEEWESLTQPGRPRPGKAAARQAVDPVAERRALNATIRAELHKLVRALARRDYAAAARVLAPGVGETWTPERLTAEMAPFWAAHPELLTTPAARRPDRTRIDEMAPGRLRVQQTLVDADEDEDWSLDCVVDVASSGGPPAISLQRIGI